MPLPREGDTRGRTVGEVLDLSSHMGGPTVGEARDLSSHIGGGRPPWASGWRPLASAETAVGA